MLMWWKIEFVLPAMLAAHGSLRKSQTPTWIVLVAKGNIPSGTSQLRSAIVSR